MKRILLSLMAVLVAFPLLAAPNKGGVVTAKGKKIPGQYIIVFNDRVADVERAAAELVQMNRGRLNHTYQNALKGFSAQLSERAAQALANHPLVELVEEDQEVTIDATQNNATWGIDRIDQRDLPLSGTYTYNYTGSGVKAYIIDTGIRRTHTDFGGRAIHGYTAISDGRGSDDCNGHGTHVAGTVGGATWGVAKSVTLVAVRVLDCNGSGSNSGVIAGVDWVTSDHASGAPAVANMSLGGGASSALDTAVKNSIADGVTYAIASGNSNADACNYSPARVAEAITVNSSTSSDARSSFSNWGSCTDIFAPGSSITSAWHTSDTATNTISGTSMATPHVAGVAALYLHQHGYQSPSTVASAIYNASTLNKISGANGSPNRLLYSLFGSTGSAPSISGFSPTCGPAGTSVKISGSNFTGASKVTFNGTSASFTVDSSSQITATVPSGASTGKIAVTNSYGTGTSSSDFTVSSSCGGTTSQLLRNPGFESGNDGNWTTTSGVIDNSSSPGARTGSWKAWLCGYGTTHTDYAYQSVSVSSTATAVKFGFYLRVTTSESTTSTIYDRMNVQYSTDGGSTWTTLKSYSNLSAGSFGSYTLQEFSLSLSAVAGKTVRVRFYATEDSIYQTSFLVDDTYFNVTQ